MRKIKDILRLRYEAGLPYRGIANALNIGYGTVVDYLNRAQRAGVGWPVPEGMHERDLGRLLFPTQAVTGQRRFAEPDCPEVCRIYCATANPLEVIVVETKQGRGILGVVDGSSPRGIESDEDIADRKALLRKFGYKR